MPDGVVYDEACLKIVNVGFREYVCEGASSGPLMVRSSDPLLRNIDPSAPIIVPRRTRITPKDLKYLDSRLVAGM